METINKFLADYYWIFLIFGIAILIFLIRFLIINRKKVKEETVQSEQVGENSIPNVQVNNMPQPIIDQGVSNVPLQPVYSEPNLDGLQSSSNLNIPYNDNGMINNEEGAMLVIEDPDLKNEGIGLVIEDPLLKQADSAQIAGNFQPSLASIDSIPVDNIPVVNAENMNVQQSVVPQNAVQTVNQPIVGVPVMQNVAPVEPIAPVVAAVQPVAQTVEVVNQVTPVNVVTNTTSTSEPVETIGL